jgi:tRNA(Ile)-lysidine synthase
MEIQGRRLFKRGEKLLIAVSGGIDSMVLLHALKILSAKHQWILVVAHFNHRLRGRASDADKRLVRKTAAAMRLPVAVGSADVKAFAAKLKLSLEMAARKLRHEFLAQVAQKQKIKTIALAHHADDQVELFFLRLLRGAGSEGLAGMKWHSPSPADRKITLVRPLLDFSKAELLAFAGEYKIPFRQDATNFSSDLLRNRIRNELLPLLRKQYQPALDKTVLRLMDILGAESDFVGAAAQRWMERAPHAVPLPARRGEGGRRPGKGDNLDALPAAIQRRVLQSQLLGLGVAADFHLIESLREAPDVYVSVGPNLSAARDESGEIKLRTEVETEFNSNEFVVDLSNNAGEMIFDGRKFIWRIQPQNRNQSLLTSAPTKIKREFFDADKIGARIILRHWRPGDRFQPIGMISAAKLQDLFVNAKIPRARRRKLVLAATARGEIFWVEGLRIGERFKLTPQTIRTLVWDCSNLAV